MALDHFNLTRPPFSPAAGPAFHYEDAARRELLGALHYALRLGDGVIKVTGEPGSGKRMLCQVLAERLAQGAVPAAPPVQALLLGRGTQFPVSPLDAVCAIARKLDLAPGGLRTDEVMRLLHTHLAAGRAAGKLAVLLVEEAHALPLDTLETLRQLTNLSAGPHTLLPVVLVGTPELNHVLRQPRLRQLRERITLSFVVPPLPPELAPELLACRLRAAGHPDGALFQLDAAKLIARTAGADLHALVALADRSLAVAAGASASAVAMFHVRDAIKGVPVRPAGDAAPATPAVAVVAFAPTAPLVAEAAPALKTEAEPEPKLEPSFAAAPEVELAPTPAPEPPPPASPAALELAERFAAPPSTPPGGLQDLMPAQLRPSSLRRKAVIASGAMLAVAGIASAAFLLRPAAAPASAIAAAPQPAAAESVPTATAVASAPPAAAAAPAQSPVKAAASAPAIAAARGLTLDVPRHTAAAATSRPASLLKQSLLASKTWLRDEPANNFCVQIENFPASEPERAEQFLADTRAAIGLSEVHSYPMLIKGEPRIAIVYGSFASAKKVQEVQATLAERSGARHKIRTIKGIREAVRLAQQKAASE
ncbi:ExeA family protein [Pseudoduganella aquatica]|uniref:ExeA family protein n=1 Tax=Pseudoduganella aquatica TaxID=2660641 RepID=UPI001E31AF6F|nr:AAA family ATPase [Pseudoduganella aquatica]